MDEREDGKWDLGEGGVVIWLEENTFRSAKETLLEEQCHAPDRNVFPFVRLSVGADECPRAPRNRAVERENPQAIQAQWIERAIFRVGQFVNHALYRSQRRLCASGRFPNAARRIDARVKTGDHAARGKSPQLKIVQRIGQAQSRKISCAV